LLAAGLAASALVLAVTVSRSVRSGLDSGALQSAREVAALVDARRLPNPLPVGGEATVMIQVVDADRRVRAASAGGDRFASLLTAEELSRVRAGARLEIDGNRAGLDAPLRIVGVSAGPPDDPQTVVVAVDLATVRSGSQLLRNWVLIGAPALLAGLALISWRVIGWTLHPVEMLRRGAEEISGAHGSARRLPVPEAEDEIHRLATTLNAMLARLDAANARQRAFISDAAHELRSPLASLRTQLEVSARLDDPGAGLATELLPEVDRLSALVDDLLLLARLDEGAPPPHRQPVDMAELAADVVDRYTTARVPVRLMAPSMSAEHAVPTTATCVLGDATGLSRVLANLVENAVRHAASRVDVSVAGVDSMVRVSVADDGPGIPDADRNRVFDRFTRLDAGRGRDSGGAGLGLAIVRDLVRAHGGSVALADAKPGLRAEVTLPAAP
jgi:signal transduction histidine kinase